MQRYATHTRVRVHPFSREVEGAEIVIGQPDRNLFLSLPPDAVQVLDDLANGKSVGEAQRLYQERHGETPDIEAFLNLLEARGFVRPLLVGRSGEAEPEEGVTPRKAPARYHFTSVSQELAQKIFSKPVLIAAALLILLALLLIAIHPDVLPDRTALFVGQNMALFRIALVGLSFLIAFLHELAHLVAARSVGVGARMGISRRLWVLVAETDMTGIWGVPPAKRYLPLLAGPLMDAILASGFTVIFFAHRMEWITLSMRFEMIGRAVWFLCLLNLLWQSYFFVRTDFYYAFALFFRCKNLLRDTEDFLRNLVLRLFRKEGVADQSHIPPQEMRIIRLYAGIYLMGRMLAFGSLLFIFLPLTWQYLAIIGSALRHGYAANPSAFLDSLTLVLLAFLLDGIGLMLWVISMLRRVVGRSA